jgi:tetratricopeptide (TPR) repeat protein
MPASESLHQSLRKIPVFHALPLAELDEVVASLSCQKYKPGDRLWQVGDHIDFMGLIQQGEIRIEYQRANSSRRSVYLSAGSFFRPPGSDLANDRSPVSAYAETDVTLYKLRLKQLSLLEPKCPTLAAILTSTTSPRFFQLSWGRLWAIIVTFLIILLTWRDVTSALSSMLYFSANQLQPFIGYQETLSILDYAGRFNPQSPYTHNKQGSIWTQLDNKRLAMVAFIRAINVDKANGPAQNNLAASFFTLGLTQQAVRLQQKAAQAEPNEAIIRYNLGLMLLEQNDHLGAMRAFKEATRIDPNWALPYIHLSFVELQTEEYARAEQAADVATQLDPTQQSAQLSLAIALYFQGKSQEALLSIRRAVEMNHDDVVSRFYYALILNDLGDDRPALDVLQQLRVSPVNSDQRTRIVREIEAIHRLSSDILAGSQ